MVWTEEHIPDQRGRLAVVTGANSGIGLVTARELARAGAEVVLACRSEERGRAAERQLRSENLAGEVRFEPLDLADLESVRACADRLGARHDRIDLLINNAGLMGVTGATTVQGVELHLGVNHLGHFALTGLLLERLQATPDSRVVTVASLAHWGGRLDPDNIDAASAGSPMALYARSKLANLLFSIELQRRLTLYGASTIAVSAHPGWTHTDLSRNSGFISRVALLLAQSADNGALPTLHAATAPRVQAGGYYGPRGLFELAGDPGPAVVRRRAGDAALAEKLWTVSEQLSGVRYAFGVKGVRGADTSEHP